MRDPHLMACAGVGKYIGAAGTTTLPRQATTPSAGAQTTASGGSSGGRKGASGAGASSRLGAIEWGDPNIGARPGVSGARSTGKGKGKSSGGRFGDFSEW